jgi:hypothetical protein
MKKHLLTIVLMGLVGPFGPGQTPVFASYIEGQAGIASENFSFRGGNQGKGWDLSLGYEKKQSDDATLNILGLEAYKSLLSLYTVRFSVGGGVGFTIPNGPRLDNDASFSIGARTDYQFTDNWSLGLGMKTLFFNTSSHELYNEISKETLSNGQEVETSTLIQRDGTRNLDTVYMTLALRYSF